MALALLLNKFISHTIEIQDLRYVVMDVRHHCMVYSWLLYGIAIWLDLKKEINLSLAALVTA